MPITIEDVDLASLPTREFEVFEEVTGIWPDWQRCQHGKRCVEVLAYWSDDAPWTVTTGRQNSTQKFPRTVHLDGTFELDEEGRVKTFEYGVHRQCPECKAIDTLVTRQEAWCDRTTCQVDGCGYESVYMIGD